ncbi:MAG: VCBS repeat-containing protein, partial [Anaerolineae bacterium]|nr:VCBS repeat-containing protein [Anaerolineae bacterium]
DSSNVPGWPVITQNWIQSSPALGDLDGDGDLEVIVASGDSQAGGNGKLVYAWHDNGMAVANWPRSTAQDVRGAPALGDLDGDGALDVVVGCGTEATNCDKVYAWKGNGNNVAGFPATVSGVQSFPWAPVLADYDGDGSVEILFVSKWGNRVLESNGQVDAGASFDTDSLTGMGSPVVDDINDDDDLDVVIAGPSDFVSAPVGSAVYIWLSTGGTTSSETPWPMFHRTVDRQGAYPVPPRLVFQDEVRVFHTYGSGNTETKTVYVSNDGSGSFDWAITHAITRLQTLPALGTVTTTVPTQFVITTTDLITGWHTLGTVTVTGTVGGEAVLGSPAASSLILYVGNPARVYMPVVFRNY